MNTQGANVVKETAYHPNGKPLLVKISEKLIRGDTIEVIEKDKVIYEVIRKPRTIYAGKLAYAQKCGTEPDIGGLYRRMYGERGQEKEFRLRQIKGMITPEWDVCISIDYWKGDTAIWGMMFAREVDTEDQENGMDIYIMPESIYMRALFDREAAEMTGGDISETWQLFGKMKDEIMPENGYGFNKAGQEMEYRLDPDHDITYAYVPVVKLDAATAEEIKLVKQKEKDQQSEEQNVINDRQMVNAFLQKSGLSGKVIDQVIPPRRCAFPSVAVAASAIQQVMGEKLKAKFSTRSNINFKMYQAYQSAGGLGYSFVFDKNFLLKKATSHTISEYEMLPEFVEQLMKFVGYDFDLMDCRISNQEECRQKIWEAINRATPVICIDKDGRWNLITGYLNVDSLIGFYGNDGRDNDLRLGNGMMFKKNWFNSIDKLLFICGKRKKEFTYKDCLKYWISVMTKPENDKFSYGLQAYDDMIAFLKKDNFFDSCSEEELTISYCYFHDMGRLAEARFYANQAKNNMYFYIPLDFGSLAEGKKFYETLKNFNTIHNLVWDFWSAVGEGMNCQPELYAKKMRTREFRTLFIDFIEKFKDLDQKVLSTMEKLSS